MMSRRQFLRLGGAIGACGLLTAVGLQQRGGRGGRGAAEPSASSSAPLEPATAVGLRVRSARERPLPEPTAQHLPRWRGFNLIDMMNRDHEWSSGGFREDDFEALSDWGFNFVRIPLDYRLWTTSNDWWRIREERLKEIDGAVELGEKYKVHVCLNFHRAPGYSIAEPPEPRSLWEDEEPLEVTAAHWAYFAGRYSTIPNRRLSFNLINEPPRLRPRTHRRVVERIVEAIREQDRQRLIICDGADGVPPTELIGLGVAAATRGYQPHRLSHYGAEWDRESQRWETPTYPLREGATLWDKTTLRRRQIGPWTRLQAQGMGVMVGEFGAYNKTPHPIVLAWMRDCLELWDEVGWGWALWNFRDAFGLIDSGRTDVDYRLWRGQPVDEDMLKLLQSFLH